MKKLGKTEFVKQYCLPVEIKKEGKYFLATCPVWKDCYAQGKTLDEATAEMIAVAASLIDLYNDEDLKIPLSKASKSAVPETNKFSFDVPVFAAA